MDTSDFLGMFDEENNEEFGETEKNSEEIDSSTDPIEAGELSADIISHVLNDRIETLSLEPNSQTSEHLEVENNTENVMDSEDSAKDATKLSLEPVRTSVRLAAKQSIAHQIQKQIVFKPKKQDEDIVMPSYSWIFSDEDVDVEEEVEDATSVDPNNKKMLEKEGNIPVLRRSSRLAEPLTGQKKGAKRVLEEKEEVRMDKVMRKPWNYGKGGGRQTL